MKGHGSIPHPISYNIHRNILHKTRLIKNFKHHDKQQNKVRYKEESQTHCSYLSLKSGGGFPGCLINKTTFGCPGRRAHFAATAGASGGHRSKPEGSPSKCWRKEKQNQLSLIVYSRQGEYNLQKHKVCVLKHRKTHKFPPALENNLW